VIDIGYLASEIRGTVTLDPATGAGVPTLTENFFEFAERGAWEEGRRVFVPLSELREGAEYYLFVTTPAGLYRYDMNDVVRIEGRFGNTPTFRFVQKGRGVTNITGEKLYESQLLAAMDGVLAGAGVRPRFWQALADEAESLYEVYIEPEGGFLPASLATSLAASLDEALGAMNMEYAAKRASDRLKPPRLFALRDGASEAYKAHYLARGQREGQFKPVILQYKRTMDFPIHDWVAP
jgi:hypothetical protein